MLPNKLLYFVKLARIENYTKAAEQLDISQPTLSHNIASLEDEIGVKLFEKSGRSIMLTKSGKVFLEYADKCIKTLEEGVTEVRKLGSEINGTISLGHVNIRSNELLPSYIKKFMVSNPYTNTQFDLHVATSDEIIAAIKRDEFDVGFCFKGSIESSIEYLPLWKEEFVLIVPMDHNLAKFDSVCLVDTIEYPHITYSKKSILHKSVVSYYKELKKYPEEVSTVEVASAMIGLVSSGVGIGFVPMSAVSGKKHIKVVHISDMNTSRMVYMVYDKHKCQVPCVKRFVRFMEQNYRIKE